MRQRSKFWISFFVIGVLVLHAVPVLQRLQGNRQTWWPIMAWGMYKKSRPPQPIAALKKRLIGVNAKGEEQRIHHWQSGHSSIAFELIFMKPMWNGEAEVARRLAQKINQHLDVPIIALRVESKLYTLTDTGVRVEDNTDILFDSLN